MSKTNPRALAQTTPTQEIAEASDAQLDALVDQWQAQQDELQGQVSELNAQVEPLNMAANRLNELITKAKGEKLRRTAPFVEGDVVEDDLGVRYRVHKVAFTTEYDRNTGNYIQAGQVVGIRLTKAGAEAYKDARRIVSSSPLKKVTPEGD